MNGLSQDNDKDKNKKISPMQMGVFVIMPK